MILYHFYDQVQSFVKYWHGISFQISWDKLLTVMGYGL